MKEKDVRRILTEYRNVLRREIGTGPLPKALVSGLEEILRRFEYIPVTDT